MPRKPAGRAAQRPGPATELTPAVVAEVTAAVRLGAFPSDACQSAGFAPGTWRKWVRLGRAASARADAGDTLAPPDAAYADFAAELGKATAGCRVDAVVRLRELADDDAKAMMLFLRVRFPRLVPSEDAAEVAQLAAKLRKLVNQLEPHADAVGRQAATGDCRL